MGRIVFLLALLAAAGMAGAEPGRAPALAAASNFGQTWAPDILDAAQAHGIADLRDEIHWDGVETDGRYVFDHFITLYPALLQARGMRMSLIVNDTHPAYDGAVTPHTPEARAALGRFVAMLADRFPAIEAIEVGNEMNSASFTSGPMRAADLTGKAAFYTAYLRAIRDAVHAVRPELPVTGGAAHSIPLAWFTALDRAGAAPGMDRVALHPYTTPPEQFRRQVALLRGLPGFSDHPIEVTEFGTPDSDAAPAYLMKYHCQMALSGVVRAVWYPLAARGDGMTALLSGDGGLTGVGRTFRLLQTDLAGLPVIHTAPDPFTYGCRFGDRALVLWGADRAVHLHGAGLRVVDPTGAPVAAPRLSRDRPLLILSDGVAPVLGDTVDLGPQRVVADSFDQFAFPGQPGDAFERFARQGDRIIPLVLGPGQETGGVPWTPYLRPADALAPRMDANFLMPAMAEGGGVEIVHAFRAPAAMTVALEARLTPEAHSTDGLIAEIRAGGTRIARHTVTGPTRLDLPRIALARGERLEIAVGPGPSDEGDATLYRFTLRHAVPE